MAKGLLFASLLLLMGLTLASTSLAADPPKEETLPAPKPFVIPGSGQLRTNRYAVWQFYDVDRFGRFRPVVVSSPSGAYWLINGECFPWATVNYLEIMPKVVD
jgi:hypothetical protein